MTRDGFFEPNDFINWDKQYVRAEQMRAEKCADRANELIRSRPVVYAPYNGYRHIRPTGGER